jgi:hypothetical protein
MEATAERYNYAVQAMLKWASAERQLPLYSGTGLALLPFVGTALEPFVPASRDRHYGKSDLIYTLRRAAAFTKLLLPSVTRIGVADLSTPSGVTPSIQLGNERIFAHPEGSHRGDDVDVSYLTTGSGNDPNAPYDIERNFWFLYGVMRSTGVDLVMTAFSEELKQFAAKAFERGLIGETALARFESAKIMQDDALNHDKHVHIAVKNSDNIGQSRRFLKSDDAYNCYLALRRWGGGANGNFCSRLASVR